MILANIWNQVTDWFKDRSERNNVIKSFNESAKMAFIMGTAPTMLKASYSKGCSAYKHPFSAWINTGFRIQALAGRALSKEEMVFIGEVVLNNEELLRRLVALGWDTLEVHDDKGQYGCRWKLIDYINMGIMIE